MKHMLLKLENINGFSNNNSCNFNLKCYIKDKNSSFNVLKMLYEDINRQYETITQKIIELIDEISSR